MAGRKDQPVAGVLVPIEDILVRVTGGGTPATWQVEAEELAATMPAAVSRDWAGRVALAPLDAERVFLRLQRERQQATEEQAARLAELERDRPEFLGAGVFRTDDPGVRAREVI